MSMITLYYLFHLFCYLQCEQQIASNSLTSQAPLTEDLQYSNQLWKPRASHDLVQSMFLKYTKVLRAKIDITTLYHSEMSKQGEIIVCHSHQGRMLLYTSSSGNYTITLASDCQECPPGQNSWCKPEPTHSAFSTRHHYKTNILLETSSGMVVLNVIYISKT